MKVLLVFAHPDDETFSSSGTVSMLTRNGWTAKLITATRGEAGMLGNPPITTRKNLGKVREQELKKAAKIVGISKIYFLNFIDGTLHKIPQQKLLTKISKLIKKERPDVVLTFHKDGISNHPDHIAVSKAATSAFFLYMKTVKKHVRLYHVVIPKSSLEKYEKAGFKYDDFGGMKSTPDEEISTNMDIKKVYKTKIKAMKSHLTQKKDWEGMLKRNKLVEGNWEHFKLIAENTI